MRALILAGGRGKRFGNLTLKLPKPLIRVGGKPLIKYTLDVLPPQIDSCVIVLGYLGEKITQELGNAYGRLKIEYVQQKMTGTGGALLSARTPLIGEKQFLVVGSNDIFGPNELQKLIGDSASYGIHYGVPSSASSSGVLFDQNEMLVGFRVDCGTGGARYFGVGAYVFSSAVFDASMHMLPNGERSLPHSLPRMPFPVRVRRIDNWPPVNNQKELERAENHVCT